MNGLWAVELVSGEWIYVNPAMITTIVPAGETYYLNVHGKEKAFACKGNIIKIMNKVARVCQMNVILMEQEQPDGERAVQ